ncbi:MAG: hypothetical protein HY958_08820 [Bacteroidia bacterium]|nr:hypothetical protein [Bacteroidia bacterium]
MKTILALLMLCVCSVAFSQKIKNLKSEIDSSKMTIKYDLDGPKGQKFLISLYISTDGGQSYSREITTAEGEIGAGITPGKKKKIVWDTSTEAGIDIKNIKITLKADATGMPPKKKGKK